jgi:amino-acid N-acetyltransferase
VAKALGAIKLIFITTHDGLFVGDKLIRQILVGRPRPTPRTVAPCDPSSISKAAHAAAACHAGIPRVHIINGQVDEGLLAEVFSNEGIGTLVYANEYQQIRRALKKDVRSILLLTKGSVATDELVRRTRAASKNASKIITCSRSTRTRSLASRSISYPEQRKGELACLYVSPSHENQGIGKKMIQFVENKARELGLDTLIALSTQAFTYFQSKAGFVEGSPDDLPPSRREKYEQSGRKSKVLVKTLGW